MCARRMLILGPRVDFTRGRKVLDQFPNCNPRTGELKYAGLPISPEPNRFTAGTVSARRRTVINCVNKDDVSSGVAFWCRPFSLCGARGSTVYGGRFYEKIRSGFWRSLLTLEVCPPRPLSRGRAEPAFTSSARQTQPLPARGRMLRNSPSIGFRMRPETLRRPIRPTPEEPLSLNEYPQGDDLAPH